MICMPIGSMYLLGFPWQYSRIQLEPAVNPIGSLELEPIGVVVGAIATIVAALLVRLDGLEDAVAVLQVES